MTFVDLIKSLSAEVREATIDYKMQSELESDKKISVYEQEIPEEEFDSNSYYPLVIVALQSVDDELETIQPAATVASVGLTIGVYGENKDAWKDLLNLTAAIRLHLESKPIIGKKFRLASTVKADFIERQPHPFHFAYVSMGYVMMQPSPPQTEWS